jgi:hypothetical protein
MRSISFASRPRISGASMLGAVEKEYRRYGVGLAASALALLGCSRGVELEPAKSANQTTMDNAYTTVAKVEVRAKGDGWTGDSDVTDFVTPVHVEIENGGQERLRVRYSNIRLTSADGQEFRALPPFDVHGTVQKKVDRPVPRFGCRGAALAPYFGHVYEDVEVEPPPGYMDYAYYDHLYDNWIATIALPTKYMQEVALPEALIRPRGEISGFVYFERVPPSKERVRLSVDLIDADNQLIATAQIPFVVD